MAHWMCTTCGYYLQSTAPPERCPSCREGCAFNDVTCYRRECGGEQNIDPLVVGSTLKILKGGPQLAAKPTPTHSLDPLPLVKILKGGNAEEDLKGLSFWPIPEIDILKGLNEEQKRQIRNLGRIEHYEPNAVICTEGEKAHTLWLVEEGRVAVESRLVVGLQFPVSIVGGGQAFGWSALVSPYVYTATVVALYKTKVIAIEQEALLSMMRATSPLGLTIMENVASIVASRLRAVELALSGMFRQTS